jgi:hypothetical protein
MRWRFVDRVTSFEAWRSITGRKAVSLEEYYLLQPLGREGVAPESLLLESCVELARWLVAASSGFSQIAELAAAEQFAFREGATTGTVLRIAETVAYRAAGRLFADCRVTVEEQTVAAGRLALSLMPADGAFQAGELEELWREIHGAT